MFMGNVRKLVGCSIPMLPNTNKKGDEQQHSVTFSLTCMLERVTSFSIAAMQSD
jgi:hypothetical protein